MEGLIGGLAGSFLKNYIGKKFGGTPWKQEDPSGFAWKQQDPSGFVGGVAGDAMKKGLGGLVGGLGSTFF